MQLEEMRSVATKQSAETTKSKEDCNDLRATIANIRDKINNLEMQVIDIRLPVPSITFYQSIVT